MLVEGVWVDFEDNAIQIPAIAKRTCKHFPKEWEVYQNDSIFWGQD